ncbi:hypothetical protein [Sorangium sp. So ce1153]|uniref:hypothetical protein n=1 Tax=Sorangium sp. So ce1153 TaxID=3133333 RepID=UPI003F5DD4EE
MLPPWAAALALLSPVLGSRAMPRLPLSPAEATIPRVELACRVIAAMVMAWLIMRSAGVAPAGVSGLAAERDIESGGTSPRKRDPLPRVQRW